MTKSKNIRLLKLFKETNRKLKKNNNKLLECKTELRKIQNGINKRKTKLCIGERDEVAGGVGNVDIEMDGE